MDLLWHLQHLLSYSFVTQFFFPFLFLITWFLLPWLLSSCFSSRVSVLVLWQFISTATHWLLHCKHSVCNYVFYNLDLCHIIFLLLCQVLGTELEALPDFCFALKIDWRPFRGLDPWNANHIYVKSYRQPLSVTKARRLFWRGWLNTASCLPGTIVIEISPSSLQWQTAYDLLILVPPIECLPTSHPEMLNHQ